MIRTAQQKCAYVLGAKSSHMALVFNFSCSYGARTRKLVKIRPNIFQPFVLTGNDKNWTEKCVGMIRV